MSVVETEPEIERVAGFSLLGSLGKRVLRPGGAELTERLLDELAIGSDDDVLEIAPGRGRTARLILDSDPASYTAVDRDEAAEASVTPMLRGPSQRFRLTSVSRTGLDDTSCSVAVGEAVLTMHPAVAKTQIVAELARVIRPGGRLGLHEVAFQTDDVDSGTADADVEQTRIRAELTAQFKVSFNALTMAEWTDLLSDAGFDIRTVHTAPLRLLEPDRIVADEGVAGAARFAANVLASPEIRKRIIKMRSAMRRNAPYLRAVALVAIRRP